MKGFLFGFSIYFSGLRLWMGNKRLLTLSIIPFLLDLIAFGVGIYYTATHVSGFVSYFDHAPVVWYQHITYWIVYVLTAISVFFVSLFLVLTFANLISFPFNDRLAEHVLKLHGEEILQPKDGRERLGKTLRNLIAMMKKMPLLAGAGVIVAVSSLIPGLGLFGAALGVFLMAIDRIDYACDHYQLSFRERIDFVRSHFSAMLGFSIALGLTTLIPLANIFLLPGGVVAGAILVARLKGRSLQKS